MTPLRGSNRLDVITQINNEKETAKFSNQCNDRCCNPSGASTMTSTATYSAFYD